MGRIKYFSRKLDKVLRMASMAIHTPIWRAKETEVEMEGRKISQHEFVNREEKN